GWCGRLARGFRWRGGGRRRGWTRGRFPRPGRGCLQVEASRTYSDRNPLVTIRATPVRGLQIASVFAQVDAMPVAFRIHLLAYCHHPVFRVTLTTERPPATLGSQS